MVTMKNVSEMANVSPATVSHVINNTRYVSEDVRERVLASIKALNYKPNYAARTLRGGKSNTIGLIVPNTRNPYFTEIAWEIEQVAYKNDYSVIICNTENTPEKEKFYINVLAQKQVDGIIYITCGDYKLSTDILFEIKTPFVVVDKEISEEGDTPVVVTNEYEGARLATEYLIGLGHKRIACITGGENEQITSKKRIQGFEETLMKHDINIDMELIVHGNFLMLSGYDAAFKLLKMKEPPTAIFAFNDLMALGVLRAANELNCNVPKKLSVIGFDDIEMASFSIPALTTISQKKQAIAQNVFQSLFDMINKETIIHRKIELEPELVVRSSCGILNFNK